MHPIHQALDYAARALGFSALGIADAHLPQGNYLAEFIRDGKHADMEWMARHLPARQNPAQVLPGVRRIIILTYEYPRQDARKASGHIARYAQGEDYHKLLAGKLADLDETLQFYGGVQRCFTDSGPVSERFFAAQAGLGWIGRNGLLIRPKGGSYCFLASILTTLEIPVTPPMSNHCGNCHRCEQACPTADAFPTGQSRQKAPFHPNLQPTRGSGCTDATPARRPAPGTTQNPCAGLTRTCSCPPTWPQSPPPD